MRKKPGDEYISKAKRREIKKRPRMAMHGRSLRSPSRHAGGKITTKR